MTLIRLKRAVACIGRRDLKRSERAYLESIGADCAERGYVVSTGNAPGADQAYALGASIVNPGLVELYLPWEGFERRAICEGNKIWLASQATAEHVKLAMSASPGWDYIKETVKPLCIRNAMIVYRWAQPVDKVIAFPDTTQHGWGGTGHTMRVAASLGIPVWLANRHCFWDPTQGLPEEELP